jgi:hypothetical protein
MIEPASDIRMEDGDPASNDQYFHNSDGVYANPDYDGYPAMELDMASFDQIPTWHDDSSPIPSGNLPVHMAQSWVPDQSLLQPDMHFLSPNIYQPDNSFSECNAPSFSAYTDSIGYQEPVSPMLSQTIRMWMCTEAATFQVPTNMRPVSYPYSHSTSFPTIFDHTLPLAMDFDTPPPTTLVNEPEYNSPLLETFYQPFATTLRCDLMTPNISLPDFAAQMVWNSNLYSELAPVGSTKLECPKLQVVMADTPKETANCDTYAQAIPSHSLAEPIIPASSAMATQSTMWPTAQPTHRQTPLAQASTVPSKRRRHILDEEDQDHLLRNVQQRVSKRAGVPQSSVNILKFHGEGNRPTSRSRRTKSQKQDMQDLALTGGSCTRCTHLKKKVRVCLHDSHSQD